MGDVLRKGCVTSASRRSPSPKAEKPQATVESSSKAAKPRADEASTPPQSPRLIALRREAAGRDGANVEHALRDKSAKWSFKKGDDPSKMGSAKESTRHRMLQSRGSFDTLIFSARSPPPSSDGQPRSDEPSSAKAAASASAGTPPQSPRRDTSLMICFCLQRAILVGVRSRYLIADRSRATTFDGL